ncbi:OmpA family protein [Ferruginibacter sp. HRS2-29]|uniref:OmpA family protein n=1 Tax=Ferruginibacter sp. HRS2-29 TaxID=2487334 RepID=UPI0020CF32BE|nr:OmpA family protein [Ferruginibacter sp. HRS2-29]MCP9750308.1 OmpA family protein [Ferruginibacter sp. HRS2-29]
MKKHLLFFAILILCIAGNTYAQTADRYTISGGVLGAANYSKFRLKDDIPGTDMKFKWGYAPGVWVNFPMGNTISLELQAQYSRIGSKAETGNITSLDQELTYISVPLFFKLHAGKYFAFALGGQADFLTKATDKTSPVDVNNKDFFEKTSLGVLGGVEFIPRGRVSIYAKYVHGLKRLADDANANPAAYNQQIQAGLKFKLFGKRIPGTPPPPPPPVITDRDGDGVLDADDKCPDVAGTAALQGCPDRDGDGIADAEDKCPDQAGVAKYQGCPIPDTDGDGINDEEDKCPTVKGVARYQGCPIPDTDGDGVNDEEDKCPSRSGPASNQGCPVIAKEVIEKVNFAAKNVFFATGSYKLLAKSNRSLDAVVDLLKSDASLMIDIDGHTDSQGSDESNQVLSDNRAGAVKNYLVSKGIDPSRLKSTGYGETKPVADNASAAGRAKNRRTEMVVRNF